MIQVLAPEPTIGLQPVEPSPRRKNVGALVVGGDHPGLGVVRSLGQRGIPVYVLEDQQSISRFSKYTTRVIRTKNLLDDQSTINVIMDAGERYGLQDWVLFPTRDEHVAAFSLHRERLEQIYRVTTPPWEIARWAWDKNNTYKFAEKLGIPVPHTWTVRDASELPKLYAHLPLAIKPAIKEKFFYATGAKAWRAETPEQLHKLFERAKKQILVDEILIQEIIPGNGDQQLSYCAFFSNGKVHSSLIAKRKRQHPREFGRAATYVETAEAPEIEELSERFLKAMNYYGVVEIEFKQDSRDGKYKLLDVNARTWGFHILGQAAGVDFPYLLFADQLGESLEPNKGKPGIGWLRLITDLSAVTSAMIHGDLGLRSYFLSLRRTRVESVFSWKDPLPSLSEVFLLPYLIAKKYF